MARKKLFELEIDGNTSIKGDAKAMLIICNLYLAAADFERSKGHIENDYKFRKIAKKAFSFTIDADKEDL